MLRSRSARRTNPRLKRSYRYRPSGGLTRPFGISGLASHTPVCRTRGPGAETDLQFATLRQDMPSYTTIDKGIDPASLTGDFKKGKVMANVGTTVAAERRSSGATSICPARPAHSCSTNSSSPRSIRSRACSSVSSCSFASGSRKPPRSRLSATPVLSPRSPRPPRCGTFPVDRLRGGYMLRAVHLHELALH